MDVLLKILVVINDVKKLRFFYDVCEEYIYGLELLDVYLEFYGDLFIFILMKKLFEVRCIMLRSYDEMMWILVDFRK